MLRPTQQLLHLPALPTIRRPSPLTGPFVLHPSPPDLPPPPHHPSSVLDAKCSSFPDPLVSRLFKVASDRPYLCPLYVKSDSFSSHSPASSICDRHLRTVILPPPLRYTPSPSGSRDIPIGVTLGELICQCSPN